MAQPNSNYTELMVTTLEYRAPAILDAVTANNAILAWMKANGNISIIAGGTKILEPVAFASNGNGGWYQGSDSLAVGLSDEFTNPEFAWKQLAVPVVATGFETDVANVGQAAVFDLLKERMVNAERTADNILSTSMFSDGTGTGGKELTGLRAMLPTTVTTGTYGGINRATATNAWWRPKYTDTGAVPTVSTIQGLMNTFYYPLVRGNDRPDLIVQDATVQGAYEASLQANQRFTDPKKASLGFNALMYKDAAVVMDGNCTAATQYWLNTKFMRLRVARNRNFKVLPRRDAFDQDVQMVLLAAALNLTCTNAYLMGRLEYTI